MKKLILIVLITLLVASGFFYHFFSDEKAMAEEDGRIIRIESSADHPASGIVITPSELQVDKQIIVIWLDFIQEGEINITFNDPQAVVSATSNPMGFVLNDNGEFSARYMPHIATASLRFIKSGTYSYTVTSQSNPEKTFVGKIIVR
jgi:hypothetical protein